MAIATPSSPSSSSCIAACMMSFEGVAMLEMCELPHLSQILKSQCPGKFSMSRHYESNFQEIVPVSLLVNFWSKDAPLRFRLECATYLMS